MIISFLLTHHVYFLNAFPAFCFSISVIVAACIPNNLGREDAPAAAFSSPKLPVFTSQELEPEIALVGTAPLDCLWEILSIELTSHQAKLSGMLLHPWNSTLHTLLHLFRAPNPTSTVIMSTLIKRSRNWSRGTSSAVHLTHLALTSDCWVRFKCQTDVLLVRQHLARFTYHSTIYLTSRHE